MSSSSSCSSSSSLSSDTRSRDSAYGTCNGFKAPPPEKHNCTSPRTDAAGDRAESRQSDDQDGGGDNKATDDEFVEDYEPLDAEQCAAGDLVDAQSLAYQLDKECNTLEERHTFIDNLRFKDENGILDQHPYVLAHVYQHRADVPVRPEYERKREEHMENLFHSTHITYDDEEAVCIEEQQQKLFGGWAWPAAASSSKMIIARGPKDEARLLVAPRGHTWQNLREHRSPHQMTIKDDVIGSRPKKQRLL